MKKQTENCTTLLANIKRKKGRKKATFGVATEANEGKKERKKEGRRKKKEEKRKKKRKKGGGK